MLALPVQVCELRSDVQRLSTLSTECTSTLAAGESMHGPDAAGDVLLAGSTCTEIPFILIVLEATKFLSTPVVSLPIPGLTLIQFQLLQLPGLRQPQPSIWASCIGRPALVALCVVVPMLHLEMLTTGPSRCPRILHGIQTCHVMSSLIG